MTSQVWITGSNLAQVWIDFILLRYKDSWVRTRKFFKEGWRVVIKMGGRGFWAVSSLILSTVL